MKKIFQEKKIIFEENKLLTPFTTWKIGGFARYFITIADETTLIKVLMLNKKKRQSLFILGGGSNVLISDKGFPGIVLKIELKKWVVSEHKAHWKIQAGAGNNLTRLVGFGKNHGLSSVLIFAKIPGTIGGAVVGNAGAWGYWIAQYITAITYYDFHAKKYVVKNQRHFFSYRQSIFKKKQKIIITEVEFTIPKKPVIDEQLIQKNLEYRSTTQPKGFSAGCVFANPPGRFAGVLIEQAGCKGLAIGEAVVSSIHSNFFLNKHSATASDMYTLIQTVKQRVFKKTKIQLREEIRYVGEF